MLHDAIETMMRPYNRITFALLHYITLRNANCFAITLRKF